MTEQGRHDKWESMGIRTDIPHPARIYDYWLGGEDNFAIDRETAERGLELVPEFRDYARGNRQFMARATRFLCEEAGIRQFLDIGAGLLTSPTVHGIAQAVDPGSRVVYVDNDPIVSLHAEDLMAKDHRTTVIQADMRDSNDVLDRAGELLDFTQPAAVMFVACLHHIEDDDDPGGIVERYISPLAPGSYLILSHFTDDFAYARLQQVVAEARERQTPLFPRSKDAILHLFNGRPLIDPGLVLVPYWRPDKGQPGPDADRAWAYGGHRDAVAAPE
jgi:S-adenosyl methyltransferase